MTPSVDSNTTIPNQITEEKKGSKRIIKRQKNKRKLAKKIKDNKKLLEITCPICLECLDLDAVSATRCGHVFCTGCLKKALRQKSFCPVCRKLLKGSKRSLQLYLNTD